jgi:hypothetical protein
VAKSRRGPVGTHDRARAVPADLFRSARMVTGPSITGIKPLPKAHFIRIVFHHTLFFMRQNAR